MNTEKIIEKLSELSSSAQKKAERFINYLYKNEVKRKRKRISNKSKDKFIGLWKDRKDMKDSVAWKRRIRKEEWTPK